MSCKWDGRERPRILSDRHGDECRGETCTGCLPCSEPHCRVCGITHADGTCPECLATTRESLHEIGRRCDALPEEVEHRGIDGEAMTLLGPACDPESRGHLEASVLAGRVSADYLEDAAGERHPRFVVATWDVVWRDALEHDEAEGWTLAVGIDYLDRQMAYMAGFEHVPFEDFARDVRDCVSHLQSVLHDQNQGDRANVGCFQCGGDLERPLGKEGFEDVWTCGRCRRKYTPAEYNFALRAKLEEATTDEVVA